MLAGLAGAANVSDYRRVNTAFNHTVYWGVYKCHSTCQKFYASPVLREVMPEEVIGSQFDGFLWGH